MNLEQELKCVFCDEAFSDKEALQVHFRKHADPNFNQKKIRGRPADDSEPSPQGKDQVEMVECDVCPEVFTSISKAITHKHKFHPDHDAKYFCPWCGKLFTMKHLYNKHIQANHLDSFKDDNIYFHCDSCSVDFNIPTAMMYHNKFFHRTDTEFPTIGSSKKLIMYKQEAVQIYYCPFCGEEYDNKMNVNKHICDDHSDENQNPDHVLRCPLCDALFFHLDAYECHLTHHSIEDMYSERNEMADQVTDFSLETVSPISEEVQSVTQPKGTMGIEDLLEMANDEPQQETKEKKSKKHKKHKKSKKSPIDEFLDKKSAITLDEFLNMNKDVFGDGIDFQGIEEVPTKALAKRLNKKKTASKLPPDIEKLKKQGIVVKQKQGNVVRKMNKTSQKQPQNKKQPLQAKLNSDDVLSKLLNQTNSQIKIVKKASAANTQNDETDISKQDEFNNSPQHSETEKEIDKSTNDETSDRPINNEFPSSSQSHAKQTVSNNSELNLKVTEVNPIELKGNDSKISSENDEINKPVTQNIKSALPMKFLENNANLTVKYSKHENEHNNLDQQLDDEHIDHTNEEHDAELEENTKNKSLNVLKHLSHLTVKSTNQSKITTADSVFKTPDKRVSIKKCEQRQGEISKNITSNVNDASACSSSVEPNEDDKTNNEFNKLETLAKEHKTPSKKIANILNNPQLSVQTTKQSKGPPQKDSPKEKSVNDANSSFNLLKHLTNVTAKPVTSANKNISNCTVASPKSSPKSVTNIKTEIKNPIVKKEMEEDIEIFNIDDSDSDEGLIKSQQIEHKNKSIETLKNIKKNITVKSFNQSTSETTKIFKQTNKTFQKTDSQQVDDFDKVEDNPVLNKQDKNQNVKQKAINNVLKNLSKNITVKSPQSVKNKPLEDFDFDSNEAGSEQGSPPGKVTITEIDNMSDDEIAEDLHKSNASDDNIDVQYPEEFPSDHERQSDQDIDDHLSDTDIETQISKNTNISERTSPRATQNLSTLKKLSKDITIKSSNPTKKPTPDDDIPPFAKNLSNQLTIKNMQRQNNSSEIAKTANRNQRHIEQASSSNNQSQQKTLSNQVNTKEVKTVKTFQTQMETVIEEITTTVTKTIKTVNHTTKQEVRHQAGQSTSSAVQRVQKTNVNPSQRHFQGVRIRQPTPNPSTRIRCNLSQPVRMAPNIRPSNQLVPVRPRLTAPKLKPGMAGPKCMKPSTSGIQRHQIGTQVKLTSNAVNSAAKRSNDETSHFSCFKKPKESLIPGTDYQMSNDDSSVQYSSVQMNKSNYSCTTKAVKGNSIVTSSQMKSESSCSQLSKLKNMSGLSVMKTSQKQAHMEERSEVSTSQKNALEAIQKLQNQGLLVKKPRLEVNAENESDPPSDNEQFSDDEFHE